jgi:uncharacterized protein (TIGR00725 family)
VELRRVTVFGSSSPLPDSPEYARAFRVGQIVARHGLELVNGGYTGTMEASARGAREAGGEVTGVTVRTFTYAPPNAWLTRIIEAPDLFHRLSELMALGDLYVVLPGSTGTLVELSLVWESFNKGLAEKSILADPVWQAVRVSLSRETRMGALWPAGAAAPAASGLFFCEDLPSALDRFLGDSRRGRSSGTPEKAGTPAPSPAASGND